MTSDEAIDVLAVAGVREVLTDEGLEVHLWPSAWRDGRVRQALKKIYGWRHVRFVLQGYTGKPLGMVKRSAVAQALRARVRDLGEWPLGAGVLACWSVPRSEWVSYPDWLLEAVRGVRVIAETEHLSIEDAWIVGRGRFGYGG